ncbi:MAG: phytoene desaturase family protein [Anaerolineae bacterium]
MAEQYDVIVIGAGPNGLTCAAYLAKAGAKTLLLEKKHEAGGGLYTEDYGTAFRFNAHATYMLLAEWMPPHRDLELEEGGVSYIRPEAQVGFLYNDGKALVLYSDPARSAEAIRQFASEDGAAFERMYAEFKEMSDELLIPATFVPPLPIGDQMELLNRTDLGRRLAEVSEMTPREIVDSYGFQDPRVKGAMLHLATMWGIHPDVGGVGYLVPLYVYRMMNAALVRGGSHTLASALYSAVVHNGGEYLDTAEVGKIAMENGAATGVVLTDGREFRGQAIISTLNPEQTFLNLIGEEYLPVDLAAVAEEWEWEEWSLFSSHLGIKGDPPQYKAAEFNPDVNSTLINVIGVESPDDVMGRIAQIEAGQLPEPSGDVTCTTIHDPLQASKGPYGPLHTLRWQSLSPSEVDGQEWDTIKQEYADRCFEKWKEYAPNLAQAKVLFNFVYSPLDVERRLATMRKGSIKHGAYTSTQMGYLRPNEDCSSYRTPISGLYVAGASVYPGGMVILGPGYNAAKVVAEDLGVEVWWSRPEYIQSAVEKEYLPVD